MSEAAQPEPSERLLDLIFVALEHGVRSVQAGDGPLIPFLLAEDEADKWSLSRFLTGANPNEARQQALEAVGRLPADCRRYAVAADGQVTLGAERFPAIIVEAGERGPEVGFVFVQRFRPGTSPRWQEPLGRPGRLARVANRLPVSG
jgi:hypothetical protein